MASPTSPRHTSADSERESGQAAVRVGRVDDGYSCTVAHEPFSLGLVEAVMGCVPESIKEEEGGEHCVVAGNPRHLVRPQPAEEGACGHQSDERCAHQHCIEDEGRPCPDCLLREPYAFPRFRVIFVIAVIAHGSLPIVPARLTLVVAVVSGNNNFTAFGTMQKFRHHAPYEFLEHHTHVKRRPNGRLIILVNHIFLPLACL